MAGHRGLQEAAAAVVAAAVTALLVRAGTGLDPLPVLTWSLALPMLLAAPLVRPGLTGPAAFAGWAAGMTNLWSWATGALEVPAPVAAGFIALHAAVFAFLVLLFGALVRRGHDLAAVLAVPSGAVAAEYLESLVSPHGTLLGLAVTQADAGPLRAVAAATGAWGLTALLHLVPATVAALLLRAVRTEAGRRLRAVRGLVVLAALVPVATLALGLLGAAATGVERPGLLRVAAVAAPQPADVPDAGSALGRRVVADQVDGIRQATAQGARVVVLAEAAVLADDEQAAALAAQLREAAGPDTTVVAGLRHLNRNGTLRNEAWLLVPGKPDTVYAKRHLVPGPESGLEPGTGPVTLRVPSGRWALAICKDLDFPAVTAQYARSGADLLLVPGWDFPPDGWYHSRSAVLHAAEQGLPMIRSARDGLLTVSDASGRVIAEAASSRDRTVLVTADLPLEAARTPYGRTGDLLPWLGAVVLAVCVALALELGRT